MTLKARARALGLLACATLLLLLLRAHAICTTTQEVRELECTVSLLTRYEPAASWDDWTVRAPRKRACVLSNSRPELLL